MRVYISVDMEGIAGISHPDPTGRGDAAYAAAVELMEGEANACIEGVLAGGASEVVVNDSHGGMFNLTPERLHPGARLVQGEKPLSMVEAAHEGSFGVALFIGYHARAGHPRGTIAHTYSGRPTLTTLNGRPVGEYGINALYLGALGVPVGLVAGDDALAEEVAEWLPWAERIVVKRAVGGHAAESLHPSLARDLIREASSAVARRAAEDGSAFRALTLEAPIRVAVDFAKAVEADHAAVVPGAIREGDRTVAYEAADGVEAYRAFVVFLRLAGAVA
jgi:D-amino peptidase